MTPFDFQGTAVRTIEIDGELLFHATDVCKCVGLSLTAGTSPHLIRVKEDERRLLTKSTLSQTLGGAEFIGKAGMANAITEAGLYRLIMRADSAKSEPFRSWVVKDVLPPMPVPAWMAADCHALLS